MDVHEPEPRFPVVTALATVAMLALFVAFLLLVPRNTEITNPAANGSSPEEKLHDNRAVQADLQTGYRYDKDTKTAVIPIERAMGLTIDELSRGGQLPFPQKAAEKAKAKDKS
jgi:hypothetical protein